MAEDTEEVVEEQGIFYAIKSILWYLTLLLGLVLVILYWGLFINVNDLVTFIEAWGPKITVALITLFVVKTFIKLTQPVLSKAYSRHGGKTGDWKVISKVYTYIIWGLTTLIVFIGLFGSPSSVGISIGILGAGLAFAFQQPILSLSGWFLIMIKRPFSIGDRIALSKDGLMGDVDDITVFFFVLKSITDEESQTGKSVIVPNSAVFQGPIVNYTYDTPHIWESIPVSITYESDLDLAERLIYDAALNVVGDEMKKGARLMKKVVPDSVHADLLSDTPKIRVEFTDSSVLVNVRIMCLPKQVRAFRSDIYRGILSAFNLPENKDKVQIAYPHMEIVANKSLFQAFGK